MTIDDYQRLASEMDGWDDAWVSGATATAATKEVPPLEMTNAIDPKALSGERFMRWPILGRAVTPGPWNRFANAILSHRAQQLPFEIAFPSELYLHINKTQKFRDAMTDVDLANMSGDNFKDDDLPWPDYRTVKNPPISQGQVDRISYIIGLTEAKLTGSGKIPAQFGKDLEEEEEVDVEDGGDVDWVGAALKNYDDTYRANTLSSDLKPELKAVPAPTPGTMTNWYRKGPVGRGRKPPPRVTQDVADRLAKDYAWLLADDPPATATKGDVEMSGVGSFSSGSLGYNSSTLGTVVSPSGYNTGSDSAAAPKAAVLSPFKSDTAKARNKKIVTTKNAAPKTAAPKASPPRRPPPRKAFLEKAQTETGGPGDDDLYDA